MLRYFCTVLICTFGLAFSGKAQESINPENPYDCGWRLTIPLWEHHIALPLTESLAQEERRREAFPFLRRWLSTTGKPRDFVPYEKKVPRVSVGSNVFWFGGKMRRLLWPGRESLRANRILSHRKDTSVVPLAIYRNKPEEIRELLLPLLNGNENDPSYVGVLAKLTWYPYATAVGVLSGPMVARAFNMGIPFKLGRECWLAGIVSYAISFSFSIGGIVEELEVGGHKVTQHIRKVLRQLRSTPHWFYIGTRGAVVDKENTRSYPVYWDLLVRTGPQPELGMYLSYPPESATQTN